MVATLPGAAATASGGPLWWGGGFPLRQKGLCRNLHLPVVCFHVRPGGYSLGTPEQSRDAENLRIWD